jgi:Domain of unknown function (DUF4136)
MKQTLVATLAVGLAVAVLEAAPKIKVKAEPDPAFDFSTIHTWAWDADAGDVLMARTPSDDPAALEARVDPLIRKFVTAAMTQKGLKDPAGGTPDVQLHYYVLVTVNQSGTYQGQFLPSVAYWGLPPFSPQATSLEVATKGSLVLDAMLPGEKDKRKVIWRGMAQSTIADDLKEAEREARLKYAADELIKRFPLKKKK